MKNNNVLGEKRGVLISYISQNQENNDPDRKSRNSENIITNMIFIFLKHFMAKEPAA